jgi:hypothetical protein
MISFKGTRLFPKTLFFMQFSFMSGMVFRIPTFIHNDLIRKAIIVNCLLEKGSGSVFITEHRQHENNRTLFTINGSV